MPRYKILFKSFHANLKHSKNNIFRLEGLHNRYIRNKNRLLLVLYYIQGQPINTHFVPTIYIEIVGLVKTK